MTSEPTLLQLVYVHGFQGNDTTFQSFPMHLQKYLSEQIPPHLNLRVQSTIYPTYQSRKPISHATRNFLQWLSTQPPGPVILLGHSMGGLLVAEAATDPSMQCKRHPRIVGMIAFDCPYLGMHPRVIVAGIASLFAKNQEQGNKSDHDMNPDPGVKVEDNRVTDDWDEYKKNLRRNNGSLLSVDSEQTASSSTLSPSPTHSRSGSNSSLDLARSPSPSFVDRTVNFLSNHADHSMVKWLKKHRESPFIDGKVWITEHYQFGSSMFDPSGLANRYKRLVAWNGLWVNYWTTTYGKGGCGSDSSSSSPSSSRSSSPAADSVHAALLEPDNEVAARMLETSLAERSSAGSSRRSHDSSSPSLSSHDSSSIERVPARPNKLQKGKESTSATPKPPKEKTGRHFIVLPNGMGAILGGYNKWEKVIVGGASDVVAAHCGLFIPSQNLEYEAFVERVGRRVLDWCEKI